MSLLESRFSEITEANNFTKIYCIKDFSQGISKQFQKALEQLLLQVTKKLLMKLKTQNRENKEIYGFDFNTWYKQGSYDLNILWRVLP